MMQSAREALRGAMAGIEVLRPPVIRRSDEPEWMLATDLPGLTSEEGLNRFCEHVTASGWRHQRRGDWLLLDHLGALPTAGRPEGKITGEAASVISLLERHPDSAMDEKLLRMIAKRAEEGEAALENLCRSLHRDLAGRLRRGEALPGMLLPYLYAAWTKVKGEIAP